MMVYDEWWQKRLMATVVNIINNQHCRLQKIVRASISKTLQNRNCLEELVGVNIITSQTLMWYLVFSAHIEKEEEENHLICECQSHWCTVKNMQTINIKCMVIGQSWSKYILAYSILTPPTSIINWPKNHKHCVRFMTCHVKNWAIAISFLVIVHFGYSCRKSQ